MRRHLVAFLFVSLPLATVIGQTESRTAVEIESLDRRADPCTDFYQFACGGWIEKNPLPPDRRSYGRIQEIQDRNFAILPEGAVTAPCARPLASQSWGRYGLRAKSGD